jgi:hypothetical protein
MNVFEKLAQLRDDVQKANLKKTGYNKHLNYHYYELGDIMPFVINKMVLYKLCSNVSFGRLDDSAILELIDTEKPDDRMMFTSPMSTASLSNCHPVQNLGAVQTYIRRYLWTSALELTDGDAIEENTGKDTQKPVSETKPPEQPKTPEPDKNSTTSQQEAKTDTVTRADVVRLYTVAGKKGKSDSAVKKTIAKFGIESANDLSKAQYDELIKSLESLPDKEVK